MMSSEARTKASKIISIATSVLVVLHIGLIFGASNYVYGISPEFAFAFENALLRVVPALVIAAVFASVWALFLSAVAVALVAGRNLGQGESHGWAWRNQSLLVAPVIVVSGMVAVLYGSGLVVVDDEIPAELLHSDPAVIMGLLVVLSALAAGVRKQVPFAALLALALHAAAHVAVFANGKLYDELVILIVAGLAILISAKGPSVAVNSPEPADQATAVV